MFIIYLWDKAIGESIRSLDDFSGNENFLIRDDLCKYPLLSKLSNCDMELFSDGQLIDLRQEINSLMKDELLDQNAYDYLRSVVSLIDDAYHNNKGILFSPF
ncbi:hypothetical protein R4U62_000525 [Proteus mirabilis]|uniref:hypothetical protein n=1 Tax=Proteus TaxID=583 RepID=UPI0007A59211|nr:MULTISPECIES: hypothetical protein [Proteus]EGT3586769.1 hypothetical protein [Proteus mirabilis]ELA8072583.1 hypothetical protein [Proteus mirabilis]ELJ9400666.1 hypothetical protein [Proteus mirabilis]ELJ9438574.1 hypothetical protein [Proteus mirabilis]ELS1786138.1 hypothetical protein [Proteus mirabilis]